jgi:peptide/nickel transport system substrate-binding protein
MICDDGGALIPLFMDHIEAGSGQVRGWKPSAIYDLMGQRIGERVWFG